MKFDACWISCGLRQSHHNSYVARSALTVSGLATLLGSEKSGFATSSMRLANKWFVVAWNRKAPVPGCHLRCILLGSRRYAAASSTLSVSSAVNAAGVTFRRSGC